MGLPHPSQYDLPHDKWREGQYETVQWIAETRGPLIVQAPTGSGKTGVGAALSNFGSVRSLTHTINLQQQYENLYEFDPMYGMAHYDCAFLMIEDASNCVFPEAMYECPSKGSCSYLIQREVVKQAQRQSLSYAYWLAAIWPKDAITNFLYCDEAHLLPRITRDACTIEYTPQQLQAYDLPMYPTVKMRNNAARVQMCLSWLTEISLYQKRKRKELTDIPSSRRSIQVTRMIKELARRIMRLDRTIRYARSNPNEFYVKWDKERFKMIPLTARLYFSDLFISSFPHRVVLTSATIGNHETLARELGLSYHQFRDVPSVYPPEAMPVYTVKDAPKLSYNTDTPGWKHWADTIHRVVSDLDPMWSGLIHVSSRRQAHSLAHYLAKGDLQNRVYVPEGKGTGAKIEAWQNRKRWVPNTLAIAYSFHMGLDGYDDEINIIGKVPFATLDDFGMAELDYDPGIYQHNAAILTEQAAGRIRRGEPEHYEEPNAPRRKFVAILDNNYQQIQSEFSSHFKKCLTEY